MTQKAGRQQVLFGRTYCMTTGCGKLYITVNAIEGQPFELFTNMGKAGGCASAQCESIGRLVSYALRIGGTPEDLIKELKGIRCHQPADDVQSCADAVAQVLELIRRASEV